METAAFLTTHGFRCTSWAHDSRLVPKLTVLQHVASQIGHDKGDGDQDKVHGPVSVPVGPGSRSRLPGEILGEVGGDGKCDAVAESVREVFCSSCCSDSEEPCTC